MLLYITQQLSAEFLSENEFKNVDKFYPFDLILFKLRDTIGHSNGDIRHLSLEII